jgi:hypothetical protein
MTPAPSAKSAKLDPATRNLLANLPYFTYLHTLSIRCVFGYLTLRFRRGRIIKSNFREGMDWGPWGKSEDQLTENVMFNLGNFSQLYTFATDTDFTGTVIWGFEDGRIVSV